VPVRRAAIPSAEVKEHGEAAGDPVVYACRFQRTADAFRDFSQLIRMSVLGLE